MKFSMTPTLLRRCYRWARGFAGYTEAQAGVLKTAADEIEGLRATVRKLRAERAGKLEKEGV